MTGLTGRRRAHELAPERKLITGNLRPAVVEGNLCLETARADSVGGVRIAETPR